MPPKRATKVTGTKNANDADDADQHSLAQDDGGADIATLLSASAFSLMNVSSSSGNKHNNTNNNNNGGPMQQSIEQSCHRPWEIPQRKNLGDRCGTTMDSTSCAVSSGAAAAAAASSGSVASPSGDHFLNAAFVRQIAADVDPALSLDADACEEILNFVDGYLRRVVGNSVRTAKRRGRETEKKMQEEMMLRAEEEKMQRQLLVQQRQQQQQSATTTTTRKWNLNAKKLQQQQNPASADVAAQQQPQLNQEKKPFAAFLTPHDIKREAQKTLPELFAD